LGRLPKRRLRPNLRREGDLREAKTSLRDWVILLNR